ncbi:hypothetical protein [Suttonella ornithocola]|uniref:Uncharacterized protein n=1 Tax=Suttonella ornithocola TaxID=279832 RepID=A0A380MYE9_9GAMM|nr:hypothetical protein [Suttonella ornithocola]SUO97579.1 Uncharacterised protein [Suttonella ornithocola]
MHRLLLCLALSCAFSGFAANPIWNENTLETAAHEAQDNINEFIQGKGKLVKAIHDRAEVQTLIENMRFNSASKDFEHLKQPFSLITKIIEHLNTSESIPYLALAAEIAPNIEEKIMFYYNYIATYCVKENIKITTTVFSLSKR